MRRSANVGSDVRYSTASLNLKLKVDRSYIRDAESGVDVDLEYFATNRRKNVRVLVVGNVGSAPLKEAFLESRLDRSVVVTTVVEHGWIGKLQQFGPNPRSRFRKSSAHRRVYRPC